LIRPNRYSDSITLMALSREIRALPGVNEAMVAMGTDMNRELLHRVGLLTAEAAGAGPADLVIAVRAESRAAADEAADRAEELLARPPGADSGAGTGEFGWGDGDRDSSGLDASGGSGRGAAAPPLRTISAALRAAPGANLAFIAVPGAHAAREARQALEAGLHVMLFSDNVPLEAEVELKRAAHDRGLLLMGPDCGTAWLGGVGLGFANALRPGPVGLVAASGTGAQELSCLVDRLGSGVSAIIGTGGRDLSAPVGGRMTLDGLALLAADPATRVIVLISKPAEPAVAGEVRAAASACGKPVVNCLLGDPDSLSLDEASVRAVHIVTGEPEDDLWGRLGYGQSVAGLALPPGRRVVQGLFAGGTLCDQAREVLGPEHRFLDLGDDLYTVGRPHPMIDPTLRCQAVAAAARDPETAAILLDVVLGFGAHADPAGALALSVREAVACGVPVVASVTGTDRDPQGLGRQAAILREAGAVVLPTARLAALTLEAHLPGRA
jgi:FdrA protein